MSLSANSSVPINIFLSSAREDKSLLKKLMAHLRVLQRQNIVRYWHDDNTTPGDCIPEEVDVHLQSAQIILLLISPSFMESDQCWLQMQRALDRQKNGEAYVIPVLLKPLSAGEEAPFSKLSPLPVNKRPVTLWRDHNLAYVNVVDGIRSIVEKIRPQQQRSRRLLIEHPPRAHPKATQLRESTVKEIYERLVASDTTAVVLSGIPGAGLSTLTNLIYHYAEGQRHAGHGPFAAEPLKVRIDRTTTMIELVETLFEALGEFLPDDTYRSPWDLIVMLFRRLNEVRSPRLLVLDQFETLLEQGKDTEPGADIRKLLHLLNTSACQCRILLVSHLKLTKVYNDHAHYMHEYHTDGLETAEGIELLRSWDIEASASDLQAAVERLGGHAMALSLLASLLQNQRQTLAIFLKEDIFQTPLEHITHSIEHIYTHQLDSLQRALLLAFAVYREPVQLDAALALLDRSIAPSTRSLALEHLQTLYLLQEDDHHYRLPALVAHYTYSTYTDEHNKQERQSVLCHAHEKASDYYQQMIGKFPHQLPESATSMHMSVEAIWHLCQAQQWQRAYTFMAQASVFTHLLRWGRSTVLLELYQQLLPGEQWNAQPQQIARLLKEAGETYDRLGRKREAQQHFERALRLFQEVHERDNEASTLIHLGEVYNALQQKEQALTCYKQALSICNEEATVGEHIKAVVLNDLGKISYELDQKAQALDYYEQALLLHNDISEEATTYNNLGGLYEGMGKAVQAYRYYQKALRFFQEIGDRRGEGSVLHNLGRYRLRQRNMKEAQEYYESAWHIFREIGDRGSESVTLRNLYQLHFLQEHYMRALACIFLVKKILEEMQNPQQDDFLGTLALFSHQLGKEHFEDAWRYFEKNASAVVETILNDAAIGVSFATDR